MENNKQQESEREQTPSIEWYQAQAEELAKIRSIVFHFWHKDDDENKDHYFPDVVASKYLLLLGLVRSAVCPNCDGSGGIAHQVSERRFVTRDMASDAGDLSLEGSLYSEEEWEQEQCEWCYLRDQIVTGMGEE